MMEYTEGTYGNEMDSFYIEVGDEGVGLFGSEQTESAADSSENKETGQQAIANKQNDAVKDDSIGDKKESKEKLQKRAKRKTEPKSVARNTRPKRIVVGPPAGKQHWHIDWSSFFLGVAVGLGCMLVYNKLRRKK